MVVPLLPCFYLWWTVVTNHIHHKAYYSAQSLPAIRTAWSSSKPVVSVQFSVTPLSPGCTLVTVAEELTSSIVRFPTIRWLNPNSFKSKIPNLSGWSFALLKKWFLVAELVSQSSTPPVVMQVKVAFSPGHTQTSPEGTNETEWVKGKCSVKTHSH